MIGLNELLLLLMLLKWITEHAITFKHDNIF